MKPSEKFLHVQFLQTWMMELSEISKFLLVQFFFNLGFFEISKFILIHFFSMLAFSEILKIIDVEMF